MINISQIITDILKEHGNEIKGVIYNERDEKFKIERVEVISAAKSGNETFNFYQDGEVVVQIKKEDIVDLCISNNSFNSIQNKIIFELKGYDVIRFFTVLDGNINNIVNDEHVVSQKYKLIQTR